MVVKSRAGYARGAAWHNKGRVIEPDDNGRIPVPSEFAKLVGLGYNVEKRPAYQCIIGPDGPTFSEVPNQFHIVRSDDGFILSDATVTERYSPCNPADMAEILDYFAREGFGSTDAAFVLYDGKSEVIALRLDYGNDAALSVPGDTSPYENYLVFQNFHDGNAIRYKLVRHRVVCHNTITTGFSGGADGSIRHTGDIKDKLQFARATWEAARKEIAAHSEKLGLLMDCPASVESTVDKLLGIDRNDLDNVSAQKINLAERIVGAARNPINYAGKPETFGAIFQGITYLNSNWAGNKGNRTAEKRLESILGGTAGKFEAQSWAFLAEAAGIS